MQEDPEPLELKHDPRDASWALVILALAVLATIALWPQV